MLKKNLEEVIEKKIESFYDWVEKKTPSAQQKKYFKVENLFHFQTIKLLRLDKCKNDFLSVWYDDLNHHAWNKCAASNLKVVPERFEGLERFSIGMFDAQIWINSRENASCA